MRAFFFFSLTESEKDNKEMAEKKIERVREKMKDKKKKVNHGLGEGRLKNSDEK